MLEVSNISISFEDKQVLHTVSLNVTRGEILCLLGPSGCGKTTLLRVIAGLERPSSGDVLFDGHSVLSVPIHQRGFGLMFQDFALFPHLDVSGNVRFGLRMQHISKAEQMRRTAEMLELVGLSGFAQRDVSRLSGGERQRVALARSLATNPRLLMLDEPLGSLDTALKDRLLPELRSIIKQLELTGLYVTHDQREAFAIADRIAIMNAGRIEQVGTPQAVYRQPVSVFAARFLGLHNIVPVLEHKGTTARTVLGHFSLTTPAPALLLHPDGITTAPIESPDAITGQIIEATFLGDAYQVQLRCNQTSLTFKLPPVNDTAPQIGAHMSIQIQPNRIVPLMDSDTV